LRQLDRKLKPVFDRLQFLKQQMNRLEPELKSLRGEKQSGVPIDIKTFNAKAARYNDLRKEYNGLIETNENDLDRYESLEESDSKLIEQYNARIK
jgi:hypothetical protein